MSYDLFIMTRKGRDLPTTEELKRIRDGAGNAAMNAGGDYRTDRPSRDAPRRIFDIFYYDEEEKPAVEAFCKAHGFASDPVPDEAAIAYVTEAHGHMLCTIHMPRGADDVRKVYAQLVEICREHDLVLDDPQHGKAVDLANPGEYPPHWL